MARRPGKDCRDTDFDRSPTGKSSDSPAMIVDIAGLGPELCSPGLFHVLAEAMLTESGSRVDAGSLLPADYAFANPPFNIYGSPLPACHELDSQRILSSTVVFVENTMSQLKPGGRASILVPEGFLFCHGDAEKLRCELVQQGQIEAVVKLPTGLFRPYANVAVWLLLLRTTGSAVRIRSIDAAPLFRAGKRERGVLHPSAPCRRFEYVRHRDKQEAAVDIRYVSALDQQGRVEWRLCPAWDLSLADLQAERWNLTSQKRASAGMEWLRSPVGQLLATRGEIEELGGYAQLIGGTTIRAADLSSNPVNSGAVPYVRVQDIGSGMVACGEKWVSGEPLQHLACRRRLVAGDVLLSRSGTIGKVGLVTLPLSGAVASGGLHLIRPNVDRVDPEFLVAYLQCEDCNSWLNSHSHGSVIQCLRLAVLGKLLIPLPPLSVQRAALECCKKSSVDFPAGLTNVMDCR